MEDILKILVFKINKEEFAVDITQVERILGYVEPTRVPESPSFVNGVIKYQEKIIPIIDLSKRLGLNNMNTFDDTKIIIVKQNDKCMGMIVDMVSEVIDIKKMDIENTPDIIKGISNLYIKGIIKLNERIIIFINTEKILTSEQSVQLESLTK